ncbi:LysR family transcriptional regulator [Vibrio marisflavi]|uniref:HTH-type transcriptional regulator GltR n=1 Tax=Vibrio marisflavi CECT 7928 TaxID=634439 RepID=A0ABM9A241_9VIBR|nr:LysR family transcriptional regulator [Vibrio marisflavi]CAH0537762.1 HTH-type transcriptional regulator GltR [Vibrio marisflavi CECT 7928]
MDLQSLRTFDMVVKQGGISSAAKKLNTVQSNVTMRIQRLESELDVALFHRKGRSLVLTVAGRTLQEYAQKMLQLEQQTTTALRHIGSESGELRVGSIETFAATELPMVLKTCKEAHPNISLQVYSSTTSDLVRRLLGHELDVIFASGPVEHKELVTESVREDSLVLVHKRGSKVKDLPLILFREGCSFRAQAMAWRRSCGDTELKLMELGSLDGILGCAAIGLGCTVMPEKVLKASRRYEELTVSQLPTEFTRTQVQLLRHKDTALLPSMETFKNILNCQPENM